MIKWDFDLSNYFTKENFKMSASEFVENLKIWEDIPLSSYFAHYFIKLYIFACLNLEKKD